MPVDAAGAGANHGLSASIGRVGKANVGSESRAAAERLARQAGGPIDRQMWIEGPVVFDKFTRFGGRSAQQAWTLKGNLLGHGTVLPQHLNGTGYAASRERSAGDVQADFQLVTAVPVLIRELECRPNLQLVGIPRPRIEEVAAPAVWGDKHVFRALAVRVAVKPRVAKHRVGRFAGTQ